MHSFTINTRENIIEVVFEGDISIDEYRELLMELVDSPDFQPSPILLIDQRRGNLKISVEDARAQPHFVQRLQDRLGEPTIAVVTASDLDFGMNRMFELLGEDVLRHTGKVFRDIDEARSWLGMNSESDP